MNRPVPRVVSPGSIPRSRPIRALGIGLGLLLAGCATVQTADGTRVAPGSVEFRAYAEQVFRRHNRVLDRLMFALPEIAATDTARYARAADAEIEMLVACRRLNEVASRTRDGRPPGWLRRIRAARSVAACDRATRATERILSEH